VRLLDTDTCICVLRGDVTVIERRAATLDEVATTWVTAAELNSGAAKSKSPGENRALVAGFLATLPVLGLDDASAQIFGEAKALLERRGQRVADADLYIAAIAVAHGAIVVSRDRKRYERVPGVTVEDWTRPSP